MENNPQLTIGLSQGLKKLFTEEQITGCVGRILEGDPGDTHNDDLNRVMEVVSADMDSLASHRVFVIDPPGAPAHCFFRPKDAHLMILTDEDVNDPDIKPGIKAFGFNPETLQPCNE